MALFKDALSYTLANEGGFTLGEGDAGGVTNFGITQEDYSKWLKEPASVEDVKNMTVQAASDIYFGFYWCPLSLDGLASPVATCIFDMGVNFGIVRGAMFAQQANNMQQATSKLKILIVDGHIGPISATSLGNVVPSTFILSYYQLVHAHYMGIVQNNPGDQQFLAGWLARASRLFTLCP